MKGPTTVTVTVPLTIRRRSGRKAIIAPDGSRLEPGGEGKAAGVSSTHGDPVIIKALARGFRWRRLLEEGCYASIRELAIAEKVDRAYVGRVLKMTLMSPNEVQAIIGGR